VERAPRRDTLAAPAAESPSPWTPEGLEAQPAMALLKGEAPGPTGYTPATTAWRPVAVDTPAAAPAGHGGTPGGFLSWFAQARGWPDVVGDAVWEQTIRVLPEGEERATGVVLQWGLKDDAVAGRDLRVRLRLRDGLWHADSAEERFHCRRRITRDGECA
jgi:hypothetical protein